MPIDHSGIAWLGGLTAACIEASRVRPGEGVDPRLPANTCGHVLIRPGGRACYPAVWVQDYAMTLATGYVSVAEMRDHLRLVCRAQNGAEERRLASGAVVPPWAIPDHILFDGSPVFFPGTYSAAGDQGGEPWGLRPPVNNHYDAILIAHHLLAAGGGPAFLGEEIAGVRVIDRLLRAFRAPEHDPASGLVRTTAERRAVGFIFCDSIYMTGHLLMASLLRWRAGGQLALLAEAVGEHAMAARLREAVAEIPRNLAPTFADPGRIGGWLMAATGIGRQPDVWGTIYALHLGLLPDAPAAAARATLLDALERGTIPLEGALRHVPTDHDASPSSAWERTVTRHNHYQNGAYWHTPTGWAAAVLAGYAPAWAERLFDDMIAHLRREDFRLGSDHCAPWECFGRDGATRQNPLFLSSVTVPYGVLRAIAGVDPQAANGA